MNNADITVVRKLESICEKFESDIKINDDHIWLSEIFMEDLRNYSRMLSSSPSCPYNYILKDAVMYYYDEIKRNQEYILSYMSVAHCLLTFLCKDSLENG